MAGRASERSVCNRRINLAAIPVSTE